MTALIYLVSRFFQRFAEARLRQAEIEVRKHLALVPKSSPARAEFKATYKDADKLPFVK
jgi:hypothetical protein